MGGCYSKSSKKKTEEGQLGTRLPLRPYFRTNSVDNTPHVDVNDVWVKRIEHDVLQKNAPVISIETVLHGDWWKDENVYKDPDLTNITKSPEDVRRRLPPLPLPPKVSDSYYLDNDSDDDTYNTINEEEMDDNNVNENPDIRLRPKLFPVCARLPFRGDPCPVSEDDTEDYLYEESTKVPHLPVRGRQPLKSRFIPRPVHEDETYLYEDRNKLPARPSPRPISGYKPPKPRILTTEDEPEYTQYGDEEITEEESKCLEYSEMVKIFKPLIIQNVRIHDILPHLLFLDNHDDIYELQKHHSQKDAVLTMLDQLDKCNTLGKWQKFIDVLSACGYTYIVDNIRGYKFINHRYQTEYLKILTPKLQNMIIPTELMPYLMAKRLLSDTDKENILSDCNNFGNIHGAITLLDRITRKQGHWYMLFIEALEEAKCEEVAADLRIEELMENGRVKDTTRVLLTDIDEVPPPIPPRVPIIWKPHQPNSARCKCIQCVNFRNASNNDYMFGLVDDEMTLNETAADDVVGEIYDDTAQFNSLENEISMLEREEQELETETSLLEKKSYHCGKVVEHLKKKNQLKYSISVMEKERKALHDAHITIEESHADQLAADIYYPGRDMSQNVSTRRTGVLDLLSNLSIRSQPLSLTSDDILSPVPVYSPRFDKTKIRLLQSDKDSGTGTIDSDYMYEDMDSTTKSIISKDG